MSLLIIWNDRALLPERPALIRGSYFTTFTVTVAGSEVSTGVPVSLTE